LELIKFNVSNTTRYYVEVENGALLCGIAQSWKMILRGHGKSWKIFREKVWEPFARLLHCDNNSHAVMCILIRTVLTGEL